MIADFSKLFHQSSKDGSKGHPPIPANFDEWPDEWKTTYYKSYPRLPKIGLEDKPPAADFFDLIKRRKSQRDFSRTPLAKYELSILLKYSCGNTGPLEKGRSRRAQASGGARFPIEVYPIVFRPGADLPAGLYHYNVKDHALDVLWERNFSDEDIHQIFTYPWVKDAAVGIVMTAVFWRNQMKYGERGYRYILLEAGHIGQNFYLTSEALGIKCCALGGTMDQNLERLIDIDGVTESVVYGFAIGK
ncbi:MAG: SagB/ThcOx family dehydrogenase [Candidatus Sungbacteria bacterium]|uniref:SagB/ThcOx family dehydrogenase n=1 Tax=Candidatus Sungiibacteriota bacterium TaxID=2750080 RepID=A0A931SBV7_9BACT|nr:SagB/ThcOx family dehydrogenase [Candidatus Sungbacteria bacterium]